jgi:hypothetical protein
VLPGTRVTQLDEELTMVPPSKNVNASVSV